MSSRYALDPGFAARLEEEIAASVYLKDGRVLFHDLVGRDRDLMFRARERVAVIADAVCPWDTPCRHCVTAAFFVLHDQLLAHVRSNPRCRE